VITQKTEIRRLDAEAKSSLRLLNRMGTLLERELTGRVHPLIAIGEVQKLIAMAAAMDKAAHSLTAKLDPAAIEDDNAVISLLSSAEGEAAAREFDSLTKAMREKVEQWDDGRELGRLQIEHYEPTPLTLRHRAMNHHFTALCRHLEAVNESLWALLDAHFLQFWVWNDEFGFSGQPKPAQGDA